MKRRKNLILNTEYFGAFGAYWMIYAAAGSLSSVFMLAKGYTNSQIGAMLASANALALVLQPFLADFTDRSKRIGIFGLTKVMTAAMMILASGLLVLKGGTLVLFVVYAVMISVHTMMQPLLNSLAFWMSTDGVNVSFSIGRAGGSLGFSAILAVLGGLITRHGVSVIPLSAAAACAALMCFLILMKKSSGGADPRAETGSGRKPGADGEEIDLRMFIKRNRLFFVMSLGIAGLFFSNAVLSNYMAQISAEVNATTAQLGRILSLMAFAEIPTMLLFDRLQRKISCRTLIKIASLGFTGKILVCWLAQSVTALYAAQLFQLVAFALLMPAQVYFTNEVMSRGEAVKGQALFTMMITLTTMAAGLVGGWILDNSGPRMLTFISFMVTAAGAVLVIATIGRIDRKKESRAAG